MHSSKGSKKCAQRSSQGNTQRAAQLTSGIQRKEKSHSVGNLHEGHDLKWPLEMSKIGGRQGKMFKGEHTLRTPGDGLRSWGEGMCTGPQMLVTRIQEERTRVQFCE